MLPVHAWFIGASSVAQHFGCNKRTDQYAHTHIHTYTHTYTRKEPIRGEEENCEQGERDTRKKREYRRQTREER